MTWTVAWSLDLPPAFSLWPDEASTTAFQVDLVYGALLGMTLLFVIIIGALALSFGVRYRAGSAASDETPPIKRRTTLEVTWIVLPTLMMLALFFWSAHVYVRAETPPADARTIYVVGKQWMWKVRHPSGRQEIDTLHVPADETVKLVLTSQDVIHSFYVPAFRIKRDVLPDRYTTLWFKATRPGTYHLFCAEYCGTDHAKMRGEVVVMKPSDFQSWLESETATEAPVPGTPGSPEAPLTVGGKGPFYRFGCNACHVPGAAVRAPRLDGIYGREVRLRNDTTVIADEAYLRESILDPNAKISAGYNAPSLMPTYRGQISEADLMQLIEFIKSLRDGWPQEAKP